MLTIAHKIYIEKCPFLNTSFDKKKKRHLLCKYGFFSAFFNHCYEMTEENTAVQTINKGKIRKWSESVN